MNHPTNPADGWSSCSPGLLRSLQDQLSAPAPVHGAGRIAGVSAAVCLAAAVALGTLVNSMGAAEQEPISCREVRQQLVSYAAGECESGMAKRIESHLEKCRRCKKSLDANQDLPHAANGDATEGGVELEAAAPLDGDSLVKESLIRWSLELPLESTRADVEVCDECR